MYNLGTLEDRYERYVSSMEILGIPCDVPDWVRFALGIETK